MATFERFEQIISWQEAGELKKVIGKLIEDKRFENNYRLINQLEGSVGSIKDNIAEGFERDGNKEFIQFLFIAKESCGGLRSQLFRALDRKHINAIEFDLIYKHAIRISSLIQNLIRYLQSSLLKDVKYKQTDNGDSKATEPFEPHETFKPFEHFQP